MKSIILFLFVFLLAPRSGSVNMDVEELQMFSKQCREEESPERRTAILGSTLNLIDQILSDVLQDKAPAHYGFEIKSSVQGQDSKAKPMTTIAIDMNDEGGSIDDVLTLFREMVFENGYNALSPSVFSHVPNTANIVSVAGGCLQASSTAVNCLYSETPGGCQLEYEVLKWFVQLIGYGRDARGYICTGSSMSLVEACMLARDEKLSSCLLYERAVVYLSELTHSSTKKALMVVGLGSCHVRKIGIDDAFRMRTDELEAAIKNDQQNGLIPFLVVGTLGTTDAGSIDPMMELSRITKKYDLWYHVDGALGGVCLLSDRIKQLSKGVEESDSISLDCHKILFQPMGIGLILVREGYRLKQCMAPQSPEEMEYLNPRARDVTHPNGFQKHCPKNYTFELSRPIRGLSTWFSLKVFGHAFFVKVIEEKLALSKYLAERLRQISNIVVGIEPELFVVLFRCDPLIDGNGHNTLRLLKHLEQTDEVYLHGTKISGVDYVRVCIAGFRTHIEHIDILVNKIAEALNNIYKTDGTNEVSFRNDSHGDTKGELST